MVRSLARELRTELIAAREAAKPAGAYQADKASIAGRRLSNAALGYLNAMDDAEARAMHKLSSRRRMTDAQAALACLCQHACDERDAALSSTRPLAGRWARDGQVVLAQAASPHRRRRCPVAARAPRLQAREPQPCPVPGRDLRHAELHFRAEDGSGYEVLADTVIDLDPKGPQVASRLVRALSPWRRFEAPWGA